MAGKDSGTTAIDLEKHEVALIIGEDDGAMSVRVMAGSEAVEGAEIAAPQEIVMALAMRLLKDPDFHDDVLEWYDEHQDDPTEEEEEE